MICWFLCLFLLTYEKSSLLFCEKLQNVDWCHSSGPHLLQILRPFSRQDAHHESLVEGNDLDFVPPSLSMKFDNRRLCFCNDADRHLKLTKIPTWGPQLQKRALSCICLCPCSGKYCAQFECARDDAFHNFLFRKMWQLWTFPICAKIQRTQLPLFWKLWYFMMGFECIVAFKWLAFQVFSFQQILMMDQFYALFSKQHGIF
jgi:hypothetical protein